MNAYKFIEVNGLEKAKRHLNTQEVIIASGEIGSKEFNDAVEKEKSLSQAIADFELVAEHKLPDDFWSFPSTYDKWGIEGTGMYLQDFAFYSNDKEKARLDRLQLALDRIEQGLKT